MFKTTLGFKDTKVAKILKARWDGQDMESYFVEKSKKFKELLSNKKKQIRWKE